MGGTAWDEHLIGVHCRLRFEVHAVSECVTVCLCGASVINITISSILA